MPSEDWYLVGEQNQICYFPDCGSHWPYGKPTESEPQHPWDVIAYKHKLMERSTLASMFWQIKTLSWKILMERDL